MRFLLIAILLTIPVTATAEPARHGLTFAAAADAGKFGTLAEDDSPSGTGVGAAVQVGTFYGPRSAIALQLGWVTMRDKFDDPFDSPQHDARVHWLEAAAAYQRYLLPSGWIGLRLAVGYDHETEKSPAYPAMSWGGYHLGLGARFGYDVYSTDRDSIAVVVDGEVIALDLGAAIGLVGIQYQWRGVTR